MDTGTLIEVVAMIEARLDTLKALPETDAKHIRIYELSEFQRHLQKGIEAEVASIEE
jgi:hypothetical protein